MSRVSQKDALRQSAALIMHSEGMTYEAALDSLAADMVSSEQEIIAELRREGLDESKLAYAPLENE